MASLTINCGSMLLGMLENGTNMYVWTVTVNGFLYETGRSGNYAAMNEHMEQIKERIRKEWRQTVKNLPEPELIPGQTCTSISCGKTGTVFTAPDLNAQMKTTANKWARCSACQSIWMLRAKSDSLAKPD